MNRTENDEGLRALMAVVRRKCRIAKALGITAQAVGKWKRVPQKRVLQVEAVTGIPRETLRPDIFAAPRPKRIRQSVHI
jgi:DNA-binding transcriptional regulator YdaS (Cro superfamily)